MPLSLFDPKTIFSILFHACTYYNVSLNSHAMVFACRQMRPPTAYSSRNSRSGQLFYQAFSIKFLPISYQSRKSLKPLNYERWQSIFNIRCDLTRTILLDFQLSINQIDYTEIMVSGFQDLSLRL